MKTVDFGSGSVFGEARLIPVVGIGSDREAEQRATSALLAVLGIVPDFREAVLSQFGASTARHASVDVFTEVSLTLADGVLVRPDGLIRVAFRGREWVCLVEVKTGSSVLGVEQLEKYLVAAKEMGADCVLTISNEISVAGNHPTVGLNVPSNAKVGLEHVSWARILTLALQCKEHAGVEDPEQAWILGELIRYMQHSASGVCGMDDMGEFWVEIRDAARLRTVVATDVSTVGLVAKWDELVQHISLVLAADTGVNVEQIIPAAQHNPRERSRVLCNTLSDNGTLDGVIRIPGTTGDIDVTVDLLSQLVVVSATITAPTTKKALGSVSWLTRQIGDANPELEISGYASKARNSITNTLSNIMDDHSVLVDAGQTNIGRFTLTQRTRMGTNRKSGRTIGFTQSVHEAVETFYQTVLQNITPWTAPAPKAKPVVKAAEEELDEDNLQAGEPDAAAVPVHETAGVVTAERSEEPVCDSDRFPVYSDDPAVQEIYAEIHNKLNETLQTDHRTVKRYVDMLDAISIKHTTIQQAESELMQAITCLAIETNMDALAETIVREWVGIASQHE